MKQKKSKNFKFLRNITICIVLLLIVASVINIAPGYKRDKYIDVINLIINEENKTEELKHDIYVNGNGTIYISEEDVKNLFDATIYHDEKYNQIITTSDTKVANIVIQEKKMIVNNSEVSMLDAIIKINDNIYLPISDMAIVYNINIEYIESTKKVIIDELDKGMIKAKVSEDSDIKFKPRGLSKNIGTVKQGETVSCFYTTSKGWRQIRTTDGAIGYIKANKLTSEYILRKDMKERQEATKISKDIYKNETFEISEEEKTKKITLKNIFSISEGNIEVKEDETNISEASKLWISISNKSLENQTNSLLEDYKSRTKLIDAIVKSSIENNINGISIDFDEIENNNMRRFIIELTPKLREIGISTCLVLNKNMEEKDYINIVDYIVE